MNAKPVVARVGARGMVLEMLLGVPGQPNKNGNIYTEEVLLKLKADIEKSCLVRPEPETIIADALEAKLQALLKDASFSMATFLGTPKDKDNLVDKLWRQSIAAAEGAQGDSKTTFEVDDPIIVDVSTK